MDKPTTLAFSDEAKFRFFRAEIIIFFVIVASTFIAALVGTDGPAKELALPAAVFGGVGLIIVGIFIVVAWGHRIRETFLINRMFEGEIWECWQFSSSAWGAQVEAVCNLISPKDEGAEAYKGAVYSSIFGLVIAVVIFVVTIFAIKEPVIKIALRIVAGVVFLFLVGVGIFQPLVAKNEAARYRQKALKIKEPRVWFGPNDIYHEALGHTSLKELHKITDQTKSRKAIQFTVVVSSDSYDDLVKLRFPVPSGSEERAARLVLRYRHERLESRSY